MKKLQSDDRRKALVYGLKATSLALMGSFVWSTFIGSQAKAKNSFILRPPGAKDEAQFINSCIRCGLCVEACPYHTLKLAEVGDSQALGMPYFTPKDIPCYMCTDIPCVPICPTSALDKALVTSKNSEGKEVLDINKSKMGIAVVDSQNCLAFEGIRCEVCYRECPLIGKAINIELKHNERTQKHAMHIPVVNNEYCTGCGICEKVCVTAEPAIFVLPVYVFGKLGDHYARGWDEKDQERLYQQGGQKQSDKPLSSKGAQNYLNKEEF